jgi:hypothetical protein
MLAVQAKEKPTKAKSPHTSRKSRKRDVEHPEVTVSVEQQGSEASGSDADYYWSD